MSDHTESLLSREDGEGTDPPGDLERGLASRQGNDFRHLIDTQPEAVIKYLESKGMKKLGSFDVPDTAVLPLIKGTGMLTLGSQHAEIDFEPEWRKRMRLFPGATETRKKHKGH